MTSSSLSSVHKISHRVLSPVTATMVAALALCAGCGESAVEAKFENGREAFNNGEWEKASAIFERTIENAPDDVDSLLLLTLSRIKLNNFKQAVESAEKAARIAGGDHDVIETLAQAYYYDGQYDSARQAYLKIANDDSFDAVSRSQAFSGLGVVDLAMYNPSKPEDLWLVHRARTEFFSALILNFKNPAAHFNLGWLYSHVAEFRDIAAAKTHYELFQGCEKDTKRAQDVQRTEIQALRTAVNEDTIARIGSKSCDNVACMKEIEKAKAEEKQGQHVKARRFYESALAANPLSFEAAIGMAKSWDKEKKKRPNNREALENAAKYYREASLNKRSAENYLNAGLAARDAGKWADAVQALSRAVAMNYNKKDMTSIDQLINALKKTDTDSKSAAWKAASAYQDYRNMIPSLRQAAANK